ncbi:uncharacterized protein LOC115582264 isoform X1 [Sparus aurata]|uniref:uncharacterized protein LOC115582264 isoform X1 n=2 Tax=Sparus aurata TaxID=8175 RepID=UPI0011C1B7CC|nr:uncharacterized protein LOC115582264 isoform X1 [Sparus aurata]
MMISDCFPRCCLVKMKLLPLVMFTFLFVPTLCEDSSECRFMMEGRDDLILQCQAADLDLSAKPLDVTRPDLKHQGKDVVHAYRHQQDFLTDQMDQYKRRTTLNHEDLKNGTITLRISSVDPSDSGRYRIFVPGLFTGYINITVEHQNWTKTDNSSTSGPPVTDVTEPDNPDAGNMTDGNVGVGIGVAVVVVVVFVVAAVVVVLVKLGKIKICKKMLSGPTEPEAEQNSNGPEKETLMTPETNNSHSTAQKS